ncbi:MAG TPA: hypothetical protein VGR06_24145 [Actinophytocola sp.]|jgi:hypothetical protein|uniref:hypothetical protein n=1 Tax=Actinophytocola sp. TaxID=1872138 RepID=UPI002E070104|nr:hypothetical protein [Actinophytocola sp.]
MATVPNFQTLWAALHTLRDSLRMLGLTVGQDHPPARAVPQPVRRATEDVDDLIGTLHDAIAAIAEGGLRACHERLIAMARMSSAGLASPERLDDLASVARDRGGNWQRWLGTVLNGLINFQDALWDSHSAALTCWDDLATTPPRIRVSGSAPPTEED